MFKVQYVCLMGRVLSGISRVYHYVSSMLIILNSTRRSLCYYVRLLYLSLRRTNFVSRPTRSRTFPPFHKKSRRVCPRGPRASRIRVSGDGVDVRVICGKLSAIVDAGVRRRCAQI